MGHPVSTIPIHPSWPPHTTFCTKISRTPLPFPSCKERSLFVALFARQDPTFVGLPQCHNLFSYLSICFCVSLVGSLSPNVVVAPRPMYLLSEPRGAALFFCPKMVFFFPGKCQGWLSRPPTRTNLFFPSFQLPFPFFSDI